MDQERAEEDGVVESSSSGKNFWQKVRGFQPHISNGFEDYGAFKCSNVSVFLNKPNGARTSGRSDQDAEMEPVTTLVAGTITLKVKVKAAHCAADF